MIRTVESEVIASEMCPRMPARRGQQVTLFTISLVTDVPEVIAVIVIVYNVLPNITT